MHKKNPLQFGVKTGISLANLNGDVSGNSARVGFTGGLTVDYNTKIIFHGGPYLACGVGGTIESTGYYGTEYNVFGKNSDFKRFYFGSGLGVGAEFGKFGVDLGWDFSVINMTDTYINFKNSAGYLTVGYKF